MRGGPGPATPSLPGWTSSYLLTFALALPLHLRGRGSVTSWVTSAPVGGPATLVPAGRDSPPAPEPLSFPYWPEKLWLKQEETHSLQFILPCSHLRASLTLQCLGTTFSCEDDAPVVSQVCGQCLNIQFHVIGMTTLPADFMTADACRSSPGHKWQS